jgi:membrane protease YdiL (CAAX protease family)
MEEKPKFPKPMEAFLVIIAGFIFIVLITQLILWFLISQPEQLDETSTTFKLLITLGEIGLIIIPIIYIKNLKLSLKEVFRWNEIPLEIIFWSIIIGFSMSIVGDELDRLVSMVIPAPEFLAELSAALQIHSMLDFVVLFTGAVIAAAFIEESIIRGFLQKSLETHQDVTKAVIYASLAWTIIHGMLYWAIQIFLLGILLGILAWRSNSIFPSAIGHAINNTLALIFNNIQQEELDGIYLWGNHVSPLLLIIAVTGLYFGVKTFYRYYGRPNQNNFSVN